MLRNLNVNINAHIDPRELQNVGFTVRLTCFLILMSFVFDMFIFCYIGELVAGQVRSSNKYNGTVILVKLTKDYCTFDYSKQLKLI